MPVDIYTLNASKYVIIKSTMPKMTHKTETKLAAKNIKVANTISPSVKLTTNLERSQDNVTNTLYSTPLQAVADPEIKACGFKLKFEPLEQDQLEDAVNKMKEIIMGNKLSKDGDEVEELIMIDTIQRLGVEYYFENEIHQVLERHYAKCYVLGQGGDDLHEVSLRFRLLRQQGYNVIATDTFAKFKDDNRKFKTDLSKDIKGLISLFEASQLSIKGDDILDEAGEFSRNMLELYSKNNDQHLEVKIIRNTLGSPCQRSLPRLMAKSFFHDLENSLEFLHGFKAPNGWTNNIKDVARKDFNIAQIIHQNEITQVSRWWKQLHLTEELKLARDQPVKWYMWSLATFPNPSMGEERIQVTKQISFIYMMDDIFDIYGTPEELTLFTEAVNRWDYGDERLPEYMKMFLRVFYETTNEISHNIYIKNGWDPKESMQKVWADLCNAFLIEAKWFACGHSPSSEEYLKNGVVSSGSYVVGVFLFYLIGQGINNKTISCLHNFPALVMATATILRLWDDLGSAKDENQDGNDGSFIGYYMKEHNGSSIENARDILSQLILEAWKNLNEECISASPFSIHLRKACLNLARMVPMMYNYDDDQRLPDLERHMKSFLYEKTY